MLRKLTSSYFNKSNLRSHLFILFFLFLSSQIRAQYDQGFKDGYSNGYCYGDGPCIAPIAPVTPIPLIGESSTSYQDGYNRGFSVGQTDKRAKNNSQSGASNQSSSGTYNPAPITYTYQSQYVPVDYSALYDALARKQAEYDHQKAYINALINDIYSYKALTTEKQFLDSMDVDYKKLRAFDGTDLTEKVNEIRNVDLEIREDVDAYNARIKMLSDPNAQLEEGKLLFNQKRYAEAIQKFDRVVSLSQNNIPVYYFRGQSYFYLQNFNSALLDFDKLVQLSPTVAYGYDRRGWTKYAIKDFYGALSDFNKQVELDSNSAVAYYNRGSAKSELGDRNGAISDYSKAIAILPTFSMAYNNRGWSKHLLKRETEALKDLDKAIELDPKNSVAYDSRQEVKFSLNDLTGCQADCNQAILFDPKCANAYFFRGRVYYKQGQKEKACQDWSKAGELGKKEAYDFINKYCNN